MHVAMATAAGSEMVRLLLDRGANPTLRNKDNETAMSEGVPS